MNQATVQSSHDDGNDDVRPTVTSYQEPRGLLTESTCTSSAVGENDHRNMRGTTAVPVVSDFAGTVLMQQLIGYTATHHSSNATKIDDSSQVINGSVYEDRRIGSVVVEKHSLEGGSVTRNSKFANGNMDPKSFMEFFCNHS
ncbi:uncharacterized protein N7511_004343 [Penicillium nucicola]|uniref:uncharacterized protein n=1 Tax=Penicillium nucicola TaxID=1850975 RepID=UPI002544E8D1|nr:uncharacterized protein N7511_004343 [Penicillium nucicola]KAJ5766727.1 hypothetical protein N7511_004343 [Penicillium nucicola]